MTRYAQIAVNVPEVQDAFDYSIPQELEHALGVGWLVEVPFGSQQVQGIILQIKDSSDVQVTRPISNILEEGPVVTAAQLHLAEWLAQTYFQPLTAYLFFMLPPGLGQRADSLYQLNAQREQEHQTYSRLQKRIISLLMEKGPLRGRQLDAHLRQVDWRPSARVLVRQGVLQSRAVLPEATTRRKQVRTVRCLLRPQDAPELVDQLGRADTAAQARRLAAWQLLAGEGSAVDLSWVYAASGVTLADLRLLAEKGLLAFEDQEVWRDPLAGAQPPQTQKPNLTPDQQKAWERLQTLLAHKNQRQPALLRGVTGSGKTELYLRVIEDIIGRGRQAIVMVPEISMTPQTIERFLQRFPGQVGLVHSKLSPGERYDTWRRAKAGEFSIAVGARSALFTPFPNLGALILDECHDDSYYQTDMGPYYHALQAAITLGNFSRALVLLGSATPNVETYFQAGYAGWPLIELPKRIQAHQDYLASKEMGSKTGKEDDAGEQPLPQVEVVDMREELKSGHTSIFSRVLLEGLSGVLAAGQQAILLLNRRGSATFVFCRDCGASLLCPRCDSPLTYHRTSGALSCHTCGYQRQLPSHCPQCHGSRIRQFGTGTEKVEAELQNAFPSARVLRWDADSARGKGAEDIILTHFRERRADFLVGTQMLAKGLDLPLVTLVGIVLADSGLNFPDYRTAERAFQLYTQVAGRAGRSSLGGKVILQTFQPEHYAIQHAAQHDFTGFYQHELEQRRRLNYPPFTHLVRLEARARDNESAHKQAQGLADRLKALIQQSADKTLSITEPLPSYFARKAGMYRWQIILKGGNPDKVLRGLDLSGFVVEVDPPSLL